MAAYGDHLLNAMFAIELTNQRQDGDNKTAKYPPTPGERNAM